MGHQCGDRDVLSKTRREFLRKRSIAFTRRRKLFFHSLTSPSSMFFRKFWNEVAFEGVPSTAWL